MLGLTAYEALLNHIQLGASWEGFVIEQIAANVQEGIQLYFYRTQHGAECDLILERNGKVSAAIEIKHGSSPKVSKGFRISMEDTTAAHGYIIGNGAETYDIEEGITITNAPDFINNILPKLQ